MCLVLLLGWRAAFSTQDRPATEELTALFELLSADDPGQRKHAELKLRSLGVETLTAIRERLRATADSESRVRLREIVKHILTKEGDRLFSAGEMQPALARYAEAEGASDGRAYTKERLEKTRREIRSWWPDGVRMDPDYAALARRVKASYGPWGMAALLEELSLAGDMTLIHIIDLMEEMGKEAVPFLTKAIQCSNDNLRANACAVLHRMTVRGKEMHVTEALLGAIQSLAMNQDVDKWVREYAANTHRMLLSIQKKQRESVSFR